MCGILGIVNDSFTRVSKVKFQENLNIINHRGPDNQGIYQNNQIIFGHNRLSIIDTNVRSSQPMSYKHLIITYNGEIYNYLEIKNKLIQKGYKFRTTSDTEVVLLAWLEWSNKCLELFEGMFAFAIWNKKTKTLYLARDKFGEKPLFWARENENIIFSSELSALTNLLIFKPKINKKNKGLYLKLTYTPAPLTIYDNIFQIEPGTHISFKQNLTKKKIYFNAYKNFKKVNKFENYNQLKINLRKILNQSVKLRLDTSDVPVATFLSGGIDSSIITYLTSKNYKDKKFTAYTLSFPEDSDYDETNYAKEFLKNYSNINHEIIAFNEQEVLDNIDMIIHKLGEPFSDASLLPTYFLCKNVNEKVILSGDGADEIFGGYGVYSAINFINKLPKIFKFLINFIPYTKNPLNINNSVFRKIALMLNKFDIDSLNHFINWRSYCDEKTLSNFNIKDVELNNILKQDFLRPFNSLKELMIQDLRFNLPNDMLKKVDYASMFNSLEVRLPFLDTDVVRFAYSLPEKLIINKNNRKKILKDSFSDILSDNILFRRKQGFLLPIRKWFKKGSLNEELKSLINSQNDFEKEVIDDLIKKHEVGKYDNSVILWSIYIFLKWNRKKI